MIEVNLFEDVITQIRMSRVIDGVPIYWVAAYLVDGLLIDTGCDYTAKELVSYLEDRWPNMVVNTHFHEDHIGGNHLIQKRFDVDIYAHVDSVPLIERKAFLYPYQETVWGYPVPTQVLPMPERISTEHFAYEVIETPGHSAGHVALLEKEKGWCFSGDIFSRENLKFIRPEEDMHETIRSMKRLLACNTERLVLFTSVGKIIEDGRGALERCIAYLENLSMKAKNLQDKGYAIGEIVRDIFGGEHSFAQLTNGQYTTENLVRSVLRM
ncbi:MAG TPA: MBL fold metallo-hydrolase [Syntrophales bacterium]|nr:MBL fold metallo-hydrolase [Syntrophales bacterium]HPQ43574.1 MBL fold metallo-hydrolase [Syntrophales bacterium]